MTVEQKLLAYLREREDEILEFARLLIAVPSPNPPGDERAVADLVASRLADLGVTDVRRVGAEEERPNLIAQVGGGDGPTLMLSGHIDTKPAGDMEAWETDPWDPVLRGDDLIGLGSGDMKAAVAAIVYAMGAMADIDPPGRLTAVFTADEEAGSSLGAKWLADNGLLRADACVIGEPSGVEREWESLHLVSRGACLLRITVRGTQMHSSISDRIKGVNATVKMAGLIQRMERELLSHLTYDPHPLCPAPTVNVGVMVSGGVFYGVYPGRGEFACDIRTLPGMTEEVLTADIQRFLADARAADPELDAELTVEGMVPATEISPEEPVVGALLSAARDVLGETPRLDAFPGATDAPHFQLGAGIPCVAAFGPGMLPRAHSPNEYMAASGPALAAKIYALAAHRFITGAAG